jgi:hypothetical protein
MRVQLVSMVVVSVLAVFSSPAQADLISLTAAAQGGAASGRGVSGDFKDDTFAQGAEGGTYGALLGIELLLIDVWVEHNQYQGSDGLTGTFTSFMLGFDSELDLGGRSGAKKNSSGKLVGGHATWFADFGFGAGAGFGTGQQVDPPLDNSEITDKGLLAQAQFGLGYRLTESFAFMLQVPVQYRFMWKSGDGAVINNNETHYQSMAASALLALRFKLKLK